MNITGQDLIHACSAIGAGIAMIAGIGLVLDRVSPLVSAHLQSAATGREI